VGGHDADRRLCMWLLDCLIIINNNNNTKNNNNNSNNSNNNLKAFQLSVLARHLLGVGLLHHKEHCIRQWSAAHDAVAASTKR